MDLKFGSSHQTSTLPVLITYTILDAHVCFLRATLPVSCHPHAFHHGRTRSTGHLGGPPPTSVGKKRRKQNRSNTPAARNGCSHDLNPTFEKPTGALSCTCPGLRVSESPQTERRRPRKILTAMTRRKRENIMHGHHGESGRLLHPKSRRMTRLTIEGHQNEQADMDGSTGVASSRQMGSRGRRRSLDPVECHSGEEPANSTSAIDSNGVVPMITDHRGVAHESRRRRYRVAEGLSAKELDNDLAVLSGESPNKVTSGLVKERDACSFKQSAQGHAELSNGEKFAVTRMLGGQRGLCSHLHREVSRGLQPDGASRARGNADGVTAAKELGEKRKMSLIRVRLNDT